MANNPDVKRLWEQRASLIDEYETAKAVDEYCAGQLQRPNLSEHEYQEVLESQEAARSQMRQILDKIQKLESLIREKQPGAQANFLPEAVAKEAASAKAKAQEKEANQSRLAQLSQKQRLKRAIASEKEIPAALAKQPELEGKPAQNDMTKKSMRQLFTDMEAKRNKQAGRSREKTIGHAAATEKGKPREMEADKKRRLREAIEKQQKKQKRGLGKDYGLLKSLEDEYEPD